jgi:hypothetical protein
MPCCRSTKRSLGALAEWHSALESSDYRFNAEDVPVVLNPKLSPKLSSNLSPGE